MFLQLLFQTLPQLIKMIFALHVSDGHSFPKPFSAKEEKACFERIKNGDASAKNELIEHNLRLVVHIIKKYYSNVRDQEDLVSIGTIGLIKAASTFNFDKGNKFTTYASRCIENEILMHFRSKKKTAQDVYIFDPIDTDKDGNALTLQDIMADESCIFEDIESKMRAQELYKSIEDSLERREKEIITLRYGLGGVGPLTQREVAKKLGISRSYVSRIEKKAIERLREQMERDNQ